MREPRAHSVPPRRPGQSIRLSGSQEPGRFAYRAFGSSLGSHSAHRPPFLLQAKELLDAPSGTTLTQLADVEYDCDDLASEAAEVSTSEDAALKLLKVRNPRVVKDHRQNYRLPSGDGEALILSCRGTGVWSAGGGSPVLLKQTVDADGDQWVGYEPIL